MKNTSIMEIINKFPTEEDALKHLENLRWGDRPRCPYCQSGKISRHKEKNQRSRLQCQICHRSFSATVNTIFHNSKLPLRKWFLGIVLVLNAKKSISNRQLGRDLDLSVRTAWSFGKRIREAMGKDEEQQRLFKGIVKWMRLMSGVNPGKKIRRKTGMTIISVAGEQKNFRLSALQNGKGESPLNHIDEKPLSNKKFIEMLKEHVDLAKSILMTDQYSGYRAMKDEIFHYSIDHEKQFVDGEIHTNTIESFRSLLKRAWYGQHHWYGRRYAHLYIGESCFKYNNRLNENMFTDTLKLCLAD